MGEQGEIWRFKIIAMGEESGGKCGVEGRPVNFKTTEAKQGNEHGREGWGGITEREREGWDGVDGMGWMGWGGWLQRRNGWREGGWMEGWRDGGMKED